MCCTPRTDMRYPGSGRCGCGMFFRRFISAEEERERLKEYEAQLKKELEGVKESIQELKTK